MSRLWPDPLHDKGDDFWDFDNMVNEYDYEVERRSKPMLRHRKGEPRPAPKKSFLVRHTGIAVVILAGLGIGTFAFPPLGIAFLIFVLWM